MFYLGELCVDPRPAVRKSAGQTLFSTISAHGGLLENTTWYMVLWKVYICTYFIIVVVIPRFSKLYLRCINT